TRVNTRKAAKLLGRHTGTGKRRGTREARLPEKVLWVRRTRILRRLLSKYRDAAKIDRHQYHSLYNQAKGNKFKTKRNLMEVVHKMKADKQQQDLLQAQAEAKKEKARKVREKREAKSA